MTATTATCTARPASAPAKADRPNPGTKAEAAATSPKCLCGCNARTQRASALYIPGHDARHAGLVARAIAGYDGNKPSRDPMTKTDRNKALDALPSDLLRSKASSHADRLITTAKVKAARAKADADRKAAVEAARKAS
jgi:hypothetical protein